MSTVNERVWVRDKDGQVMAIHSQDQNIPADAYGEGCTILVVPATTIQPITQIEGEDGRMTVIPTVLPKDWRKRYPLPVPSQVSKLGLRRALREAEKVSAFDGALPKVSADAREDFELGTSFSTADVALLEIFQTAKIKDADRDDIFRRAEALVT